MTIIIQYFHMKYNSREMFAGDTVDSIYIRLGGGGGGAGGRIIRHFHSWCNPVFVCRCWILQHICFLFDRFWVFCFVSFFYIIIIYAFEKALSVCSTDVWYRLCWNYILKSARYSVISFSCKGLHKIMCFSRLYKIFILIVPKSRKR